MTQPISGPIPTIPFPGGKPLPGLPGPSSPGPIPVPDFKFGSVR